MTNSLAHRGPDDAGTYLFGDTVGLGHRRLSIIDVSHGGHQPMHFDDLVIVFNGEIYNYKEIKSELEKEGYRIDSNSDTAVMLRAFQKWGVQAVHKFIGMFSFVMLDRRSNRLYLFRDRAGVKPLYYYQTDSLLLFSSELKAFHQHPAFKREMDMDALAQYFLYGYILAPKTIFKNAHKLKPGHYLELDLNTRKSEVKKYWDVNDYFEKPKLKIHEQEAIDETERLLKSAFEYRLVADVPVGIFLSGGYDSSTVAAILQSNHTEKLKTFTVGFDMPGFNEAEYAKEIASYLGTDHHELYCTEKQAEALVSELPYFFDEPFADSSAIPTILVSRAARQKVTVSLSADGGDELFGGYDKHENVLRAFRRLNLLPSIFQKPVGSLIKVYPPRYLPFVNKRYRFDHFYHSVGDLLRTGVRTGRILRLMSHRINTRDTRKLFRASVAEPHSDFNYEPERFHEDLDNVLATDYKTYMVDDILVKVDRATMSVSLEGREPLLDHRIAEFVSQLPAHFKIKDGRKKYLLKQITYKYIPEKLIDRPKMGFAIPVVHWFRKDLKEIFEFYLNEGRIREQGLFNADFVEQEKQRYYAGRDDGFEFIWAMLIFQMWYDRWMK